MNKLLTGKALRKQAEALGVSIETSGSVNVPGLGTVTQVADDYEIQHRVIEAQRHVREHKLWMFAFISAIVSLVSALAAWVAALK